MARPRSSSPQRKGKGTSFGKKSDAEKSFRKRTAGSRSGRGEFKPTSGSFRGAPSEGSPSYRSKPDGFRKNDDRPRGEGTGGKTPFRRSTGDSFGSGKSGFRKTGGKSFGSRPGGDDRREKKPFEKREGGPFRPRAEGASKFSKPYRSEGGSRGEGDFKKPYRKPGGFSNASRPDRRDSAPDQDREKRPYGKTGNESFEKREYKKPFRKTDDLKSDKPERRASGEDQPREKKSFDKNRKSFVQSRVVTSADFTKPGKKVAAIEKDSSSKEEGLTRLNKYIANAGVGSRRQADELITMGLISVNGTAVTTLGTKVKPGDVVRYEDRILKAEKLVYILLNKPKGFITTTDDPQERNTVMGIVASACKERIYPVGRLDRNTTGLLLLTNDGDLADKLTHPSYKAKKVYKVELDRPLTKNDFKKIMEGVHLEEGRAMVDDLAIISEDDKTVGLEIHIGWNRVVRRIFETLGYDVLRLDRSVFAGMDKKDLSRGQWRFLKPEEVVRLKHFK